MAEIEFDQLNSGDEVYFSIGSNKMGKCATDITLISPSSQEFAAPKAKISKNRQIPRYEIKEAWESCKDADNLANLADVGSRLKFSIKNFNPLDYGYEKLRQLIEATEEYEIRNDDGRPPVYFIRFKE